MLACNQLALNAGRTAAPDGRCAVTAAFTVERLQVLRLVIQETQPCMRGGRLRIAGEEEIKYMRWSSRKGEAVVKLSCRTQILLDEFEAFGPLRVVNIDWLEPLGPIDVPQEWDPTRRQELTERRDRVSLASSKTRAALRNNCSRVPFACFWLQK